MFCRSLFVLFLYNTIAKRTNNSLQNTTQKTKDRIPLNSAAPEGLTVPDPRVTPVTIEERTGSAYDSHAIHIPIFLLKERINMKVRQRNQVSKLIS
jgi:hypothetical protein